ncbi:DUF397 domain-containing protein [Nonomuraea sp. C10]|uniref:DUF397 domain-containing protein n=1 Tax=Nonomuraea sp. C10 TaxID=2600577 RepID=UPI0011CE7D76|nr:DUF397 domain-containing protein [Nonomuraea sp. C10]TXK44098.1 DUF397 domain-containing protein [Nonomuraea sp. C10]
MGSPQGPARPTWLSCNNGNCVQVAQYDDKILIRDSKDAEGATLSFDREEWEEFRDAVKAGRFDAV